MKKPLLIVVVGATAVGKTATCITLAQRLQTVILSADSRQFYKEMTIGTAKPTPAEQALVPHYFVDSHSITEEYSAGQFEKDALNLLEKLFQTHSTVILTGGSGLYIQAVTEGFDEMPEIPENLRQELNNTLETKGLGYLLSQLQQLDAVYYEQVDKANPQRVIRALEVCLATGTPYSSFRKQSKNTRPFDVLKIGLDRDREELYARIDQRMDLMLAEGLLEEVKHLYPYRHHNALQTVGYKEIIDYLDQQYDWDECVRLLKRNSRRYAKRQLTWFRRDTEIHWLNPNDTESLWELITNYLQKQ
jgi:tRNA dimethylallyltransferase